MKHIERDGTEFIEDIGRYCRESPDRFGLYLPACNMAGSFTRQAVVALSILKGEFAVTGQRKAFSSGRIRRARVLFDACPGGRHAALWLPPAKMLMASGNPVGFAYKDEQAPEHLRDIHVSGMAQKPEFFGLPRVVPWSGMEHSQIDAVGPLPWRGSFCGAFWLLARSSRRLTMAWRNLLAGSSVKVVVTTLPCIPWSAGMVLAAELLGIHTVFMMQGFPSAVWGFPSCRTALVWSAVGAASLREHGWGGQEIIVAENPSIPGLRERRNLRAAGRGRRGLDSNDFVVLILGQKSVDQVFSVYGYREAIALIGEGLSAACRKEGTTVALRPHYNETFPETEKLLQSHGLVGLKVWQGASLHEDVSCADLVVSMNSAALEEAYLAGKPIVQVVAENFELLLDFRVLGAPLVRTASELESLACRHRWANAPIAINIGPTTAEVLSNLMKGKRGLL